METTILPLSALVDAISSQVTRYATEIAGPVFEVTHEDSVELFGDDYLDERPKFEAKIGYGEGNIWSEIDMNIGVDELHTFGNIYRMLCMYDTDITLRVFNKDDIFSKYFDQEDDVASKARNLLCSKILEYVEQSARGDFDEDFTQEDGHIMTAHARSENIEAWISYVQSERPYVEALIHSRCIQIDQEDIGILARTYG